MFHRKSSILYKGADMHARQIAEKIDITMSFQTDPHGQYILWFYCFGTLLEFVRSRGEKYDLEHDIDIGVLYSECDADKLIRTLEGQEYKLDAKVINDTNGKPLNLHFRPTGNIAGTPYLDIFFWVEKDNILYHTYDYHKEGKKRPTKYIFKGIDKESIVPSKETIKEERIRHLEGDRLLTEKGVWTYSIFGDHSGYKFNCPYAYGTLLDCWYPGWMVEQKHYGQSKAKYTKEVKSCKKLL